MRLQRAHMLNGIFVVVALASILAAALSGEMRALTDAVVSSARGAVDLAIGLVGVMAFFLGLMRVASDAGLMARLARLVSPVMRLLFPGLPPDSPAMSAMLLNIAANMMGLANAATPFGIKAIEELDKHNSRRGVATNHMVLFLAINTSGLALLPTGMIGIRAALGSSDAAGILLPTWFATASATAVGVTAALLLARLPGYRASAPPPLAPDAATAGQSEPAADPSPAATSSARPAAGRRAVGWLFWATFVVAAASALVNRDPAVPAGDVLRDMASAWLLPAVVAALVLYGWVRGVRVYESLVEGARDGFQVAIRIIPYLVAILVLVGMFRASGALDVLIGLAAPLTGLIGIPAEALPMALLRPLSGSGAMGVASEAMTAYGPDSLIGYLVSTYQGSTETTFYVLAVYFGAVGVKDTRHAVPACLLADIAGILAATFIVNALFG